MRFIQKNNHLILDETRASQRISNFPQIQQSTVQPAYSFNPTLQQYLSGKRLLLDELPFPFSEFQEHYYHGYIAYHHGVTKTKVGYVCKRCGNSDERLFASFACARCRENCTYCRKCIMMGRVSECTPLFSWSGPDPSFGLPQSDLLVWTGVLSKGQQAASERVAAAVLDKTSLLVWAVCGAGKTEVLFKGIARALEQGQRVCIATPRTDVVLELSPRLQEVFPQVDIATLYGGSDDRTKTAPLSIATTHQLLRYYQAFDTIIIDEVDAFPYSVDPMLQYAAQESRKPDGSIIYLSATPSKEMQREVRRKALSSMVIPARYHGKMLPVPAFEWCGNWRKAIKKHQLPGNVARWLAYHFTNERPIFLFVPNISLLEKAVSILSKQYGDQVAGVHAKDSKRKAKVTAFREGKVKLLVTTTILERGVTVANVQVGVLGAEDVTFTESALVQIAGRSGRNKQYPTGDVRFFHYGKTNEMIAAKDHINRMNFRAREGGFLI